MHRTIVGFHSDGAGEWVAELSCGHTQHIRHDPPFRQRPWVLNATGRASRLGQFIECPLCDRFEIPEAYRIAGTSTAWDESSMPAELRRARRLAGGVWEQIVVGQGGMRFMTLSGPACDATLTPGTPQAVPPDVTHLLEVLGPVRFEIWLYQP